MNSFKNEEILQLIIEGYLSNEEEALINQICKGTQKLDFLNAYIVDIHRDDLEKLNNIKGIEMLHQSAHITAQMNIARKAICTEKSQANGFTGKGVSIAILDTGICPLKDFVFPTNRIIAFKDFINNREVPYDDNGHGTHVAGICSGNGYNSKGKYMGVATESNLVIVKVLNNEGNGNAGDVLAGIKWIIDNKERYNIKIVNLSIGTNNPSTLDPLVKAVEYLWDIGITVTIAGGNNGPEKGTITSPGISKKVITIGSSDDNESTRIWGNTLINFSGRGPTVECIIKPDILAPGVNITSCLSKTYYNGEKQELDIVDKNYISLSGTSMSTPMITGAIALLLQKEPTLAPDDIKYMLKRCCVNLNYSPNQQGWGLLNVDNLISQEVIYARK